MARHNSNWREETRSLSGSWDASLLPSVFPAAGSNAVGTRQQSSNGGGGRSGVRTPSPHHQQHGSLLACGAAHPRAASAEPLCPRQQLAQPQPPVPPPLAAAVQAAKADALAMTQRAAAVGALDLADLGTRLRQQRRGASLRWVLPQRCGT